MQNFCRPHYVHKITDLQSLGIQTRKKKLSSYFWSQDPYNWYVVVVLGTQTKILLENSQKLKIVKTQMFLNLKVAKIEGCQNWSCQNWKLLKGCCWFCIHFCIKWELWKTFDAKMIGWTHFNLLNCQNYKLPKLKVAKIENCKN